MLCMMRNSRRSGERMFSVHSLLRAVTGTYRNAEQGCAELYQPKLPSVQQTSKHCAYDVLVYAVIQFCGCLPLEMCCAHMPQALGG
jgi:hypothetical protein